MKQQNNKTDPIPTREALYFGWKVFLFIFESDIWYHRERLQYLGDNIILAGSETTAVPSLSPQGCWHFHAQERKDKKRKLLINILVKNTMWWDNNLEYYPCFSKLLTNCLILFYQLLPLCLHLYLASNITTTLFFPIKYKNCDCCELLCWKSHKLCSNQANFDSSQSKFSSANSLACRLKVCDRNEKIMAGIERNFGHNQIFHFSSTINIV